MHIFLWVLLILIGVPVLLAVTPVRYRVYAQKDADISVKVTVSYLLHLFHMTVVYADKKTDFKVRLAGINVTRGLASEARETPPKQRNKKQKNRKPKKTTAKKPKEPFKPSVQDVMAVLTHPDLKTIIGLIWQFFKKMFHYILPKKFDVTGKIGFSDPFSTGILLGAFDGITHALNKHRHIRLTGDFEKPALLFTVRASGRLSAAGMLAPLVWFLTRKPIFKFIMEHIKKQRQIKKGDENVRGRV